MPLTDGNEAQTQQVMDKVALNAITQFARMHPELVPTEKAKMPFELKFAGAIIAALITGGVTMTSYWVVSPVNEIQQTLARMDERQILQSPQTEKRFATIETNVADNSKRILQLEKGVRNETENTPFH